MKTIDLSKFTTRQLKTLRKVHKKKRRLIMHRELAKQISVEIKVKQAAYAEHVRKLCEKMLYFANVNNVPLASLKMNYSRYKK